MIEWNAADYFQQSSLQETLAKEKLARLSLAGNEQVLDIGCGDGKTTAQIAARVPNGNVLGIDPSRDMIAFAARHFGPPAHANLRFEVGDARTLGFDAQFDVVVSFYALHWVHEQEAALRGIRAALKPRGRTLLQFVPRGQRDALEDVIERTCRLPRWQAYFLGFREPHAHFTLEHYRQMATRTGLRVVQMNFEDRTWDFGTREGFFGFCRATFVAWVHRLPPAERDAFIADVLDRYQAITGDDHTFKFYQMEVHLSPEQAS
jgi:trans-aconitate methyltransferase